MVAIAKVDLTFPNCRPSFSPENVRELAHQIAEHGLLQSVVMRPLPGDQFQLIAGFRRFKAVAYWLKWEFIEAKIVNADDRAAEAINLIENIEREDLDHVSLAKSMEKIWPTAIFGVREVARAMKRSKEFVGQHRQLLQLPEDKQLMFALGRIPMARVGQVLQAQDQDAVANELLKRDHVRKACSLKKQKSRTDVHNMSRRLLELGIEGLAPRLLGWTIGTVTDDQIEQEIERLCSKGRP